MREKIVAAERQMVAKLDEIRETFEQSGDKGSSVEHAVRQFLREYLPRRLEIGHGEVIDAKGRRSPQTDVVVTTEDHPFTFTRDLPGLFFIEGVCAAGEVKTTLTTKELTSACDRSASFKKLEVDLEGAMFVAGDSDLRRFYRCPPWFLVAFESEVNLDAVVARVQEFTKSNGLEPERLLDAVFVLGRGWALNFGDGKGSLAFGTPGMSSLPGWHRKETESVLFDLLGWLSFAMPRTLRFKSVLGGYFMHMGSTGVEP